jgi:hypothetical protein
VAAGVIFVVDPLQSVQVRDVLPPNTPLPDLNEESSPQAIIGRIQSVLEGQQILTGSRFATPMAITMTKCDVLAKCKLIPPGDLWHSSMVHEGRFNNKLHKSIESSMHGLFERFEPSAHHNIRVIFPNHAFFGVSATGCSANPISGHYDRVAPWRVEDPLLWLLAKLKVITEG